MDDRDTEIVVQVPFDVRRAVYDVREVIFAADDEEDDDSEEMEEDEP